jgi:hypothetical protein
MRLKLNSIDLLKRATRRFFENPPVPHPVGPFKDSAPYRAAVGNRDLNSQWRTQLCRRPMFFTYSGWICRCEQIWKLYPDVAKNSIRIMSLSVGKGSMNSPRYWELREDVSRLG